MTRLPTVLFILCVTAACGGGDRRGDPGPRDGAAADGAAFDASVPIDAGDPPDAVDPAGDGDGDGLSNADEGLSTGVDTDGDGTPDYLDDDSDGDGISDADEAGDDDHTTPPVDTDGDGTPDFRDTDSDGDCVSDALEAGDDDASTPPADTDGDGTPDYLDLDSDGDWLADELEDADCDGETDEAESSRVDPDTDGDGDGDLAEVAVGTDPTDGSDGPTAAGTPVFVVPAELGPAPAEADLDFTISSRKVDAYILVDRSGSMFTEISSIRSNIETVANNVTCAPVGSGDPPGCIEDIWWGAGTIGYRGTSGHSYTNHLDLQSDPALVGTALPSTEPPGCCDETISLALWSTCTGAAPTGAGCTISTPYLARATCDGSPAGALGFGYPCFRQDALPVILLVTDEAPTSTYDCPAMSTVTATANAVGAKIVGIVGSDAVPQVRTDLEALATSTGAVDTAGTPLVLDGSGVGAASAIENALTTLHDGVPFDLAAELTDDPSDSVDAVAAFVDHAETLQLGTAECTDGHTDEDTDSDGHADTYRGVTLGAPVCWRVVPATNTTVPMTDAPQVFRATLDIVADEVTRFERRDLWFVVPPTL